MNRTAKSSAPTFEKVWKMFQETKVMFQETDKKFQASEQLLTEKFQETDKKIKELATLFTGQWGKLVEALLGPGCLKMFQDIGIKVKQTSTNVIIKEKDKIIMEIDVLLVNDNEIVIVEVKTTAQKEDILRIIEVLEQFKLYFKHYKNCTVYGAIAALTYQRKSDEFAEENGLFVIKSHGDGLMKIMNRKGFKARGY